MTRPIVVEPGVYDMPVEHYYADPIPGGSLSSTGARKLLPPDGCPAVFKYSIDHPPAPKREFDIGHAAHRKVLGAGADLAPIDADDYRTKAAQKAKRDAHAAGLIPLTRPELEQVQAMHAALLAHPWAGQLFTAGQPERALFWQDQHSGVWCRALLDWLRDAPTGRGRLIVPDYKTAVSAAPHKIAKAMWDHRYHIQAAFHTAGIRALGLAADVEFLLVVQEKTPPYLVEVAQPSEVAMRYGRDLCRSAVDLYQACRTAGRWPGYSSARRWQETGELPERDEVELVGLPPWIENQYQREMMS